LKQENTTSSVRLHIFANSTFPFTFTCSRNLKENQKKHRKLGFFHHAWSFFGHFCLFCFVDVWYCVMLLHTNVKDQPGVKAAAEEEDVVLEPSVM